MKKFAAFLTIVLAVMFSAGLVISADAPEKITIKEIQKTKGPVEFNHKAHATTRAKACKDCHHKNEAGKEEKCSNCHKAKAEDKVVELKEAFHTTCKNCHKKMATGPTKCDECHKK
jgi:uncharacterized paraquat-inducible protein A